jgi:putative acetyltransferase
MSSISTTTCDVGRGQEPVTFRRACADDRAPVIELVFDTLRSFDIEPDPRGLDADVMEFGSADPAMAEFVAETGGAVVGSIAMRDRRDGTGHVSKFFVREAVRGRGIGRVLLELSVEEARARGLRRLDLSTRSQFHAAVHLYESTGWKRGPDPTEACDRTYELEL